MKKNNTSEPFIRPSYLLIGFLLYVLLYSGLTDGIWPTIENFRHTDWKFPAFFDGVVKSILAPLISGCLVGTVLRRTPRMGWLVLSAPVMFIAILGFATDSLTPPWWAEALSRLLAGLVQGGFAWLGWFLRGVPARARNDSII